MVADSKQTKRSSGIHTGVVFVSNDEIDAHEKEVKAAQQTEQKQNQPEVTGLMRHVLDSWQRNVRFRSESGTDEALLRNMRQVEGVYDPDIAYDLAEQGTSDAYLLLTKVKCRAGEAWMLDVMASDNEKPWSLIPSPIPELPDQITEDIKARATQDVFQFIEDTGAEISREQIAAYAKQLREDVEAEINDDAVSRANRMERTVDDQMKDGGFAEAFADYVHNMVSSKAGFLKGPILRKRPELKYVKGRDGKTEVVVTDEIATCFESPHPIDMFPAPRAKTCNDGDLHERIRLFPKSLDSMRGIPDSGFDDEAINLVIQKYGQHGYRMNLSFDAEKDQLEGNSGQASRAWGTIDARESWMSVRGIDLITDGITDDLDGKPIDPNRYYEVNTISVDNILIYKALNPDKLGKRPYSKSGWDKISGSFWYNSVGDCIRDVQMLANSAVRALANNMGLASGPGIVYNDINRVPVGVDISSIEPLGVYQFINPNNSQMKPMETFDVASHAAELMEIITRFSNMADDHSGIPSYQHGNDTMRGAGRTSSGLSMLMNSASRGLRLAILRSDMKVLQPTIMRQVDYNMIYSDDDSIKGDIEIRAVGILGKLNKESMNAKRLEYLQATSNPIDQAIMGVRKRALIHGETEKTLEINSIEGGRTKKELDDLEAQMNAKREDEAIKNQVRIPVDNSGGAQ